MGALNTKAGKGRETARRLGREQFARATARFACVFAASPLSRAPDKTAMLRRLVKSEHDVTQKSSQTKLLLGKWVALGVELIVTKYVDRIWDKLGKQAIS